MMLAAACGPDAVVVRLLTLGANTEPRDTKHGGHQSTTPACMIVPAAQPYCSMLVPRFPRVIGKAALR